MEENIIRLFQSSKEHPYCTVICDTIDKNDEILRCVQVDYLTKIDMYCILYEVMCDSGNICIAKYYIRRDNIITLLFIPSISTT